MGVLTSCEKQALVSEETILPEDEKHKIISTVRSKQGNYMVDLSSYAHLQQPSIPGVSLTCGQTSYLVARRIANSSFDAPIKQNVINLDGILAQNFSGSYAITHIPDVRHLTWFAETYDSFSPEISQKEERPSSGTTKPNHTGPVRQEFKEFIEGKLSEGKLVLLVHSTSQRLLWGISILLLEGEIIQEIWKLDTKMCIIHHLLPIGLVILNFWMETGIIRQNGNGCPVDSVIQATMSLIL